MDLINFEIKYMEAAYGYHVIDFSWINYAWNVSLGRPVNQSFGVKIELKRN